MKHIDSDSVGNIFILSGFAEVSSPDWQDSRWLELQMIPANGGVITSTKINTTEGNAFNGNICQNSSGDLFVCGYYSSYSEPKAGEKEVFGGSFIAQISSFSGEMQKIEEKELSDNQKKALYPSNLNPNSIISIYGTINNLKVKELDVDQNGNITMVGAVESSSTYTTQRTNYEYSTTYYESNSVFISRFSPSLTVLWQTIVPKNASITDFNGILEPLIYFDKGTTTLLFNDHSKNISVMNHLANGTVPDLDSLDTSFNATTPVDLPPSSSDEILTIKGWQQDHTTLRKTTIDSSGKWKVSWINLEKSKESDKNAILETSLLYIDEEGNIISCVYPKYGALTNMQSAAVVKILK